MHTVDPQSPPVEHPTPLGQFGAHAEVQELNRNEPMRVCQFDGALFTGMYSFVIQNVQSSSGSTANEL